MSLLRFCASVNNTAFNNNCNREVVCRVNFFFTISINRTRSVDERDESQYIVMKKAMQSLIARKIQLSDK